MIEIHQLEHALNTLQEITVKLTEKQHFEVVAGLKDEQKRLSVQIQEMTVEAERWVKYTEPHLST